MAFIDYGVLLKVNNEFINYGKNVYEEVIFPGPVHSLVKYKYDGKPSYCNMNGWVCVGDKDFMLAFYKTNLFVVADQEVIYSVSNSPFLSETFNCKGINITLSHLDKEYHLDEYENQSWEDYVKKSWAGATGKEKLNELENGRKYYKKFLKNKKRRCRHKGFRYLSNRYLAEWEYKGNHYEVIFGYGIDPMKECWNNIKYIAYDFSDSERKIIDNWFNEKNGKKGENKNIKNYQMSP